MGRFVTVFAIPSLLFCISFELLTMDLVQKGLVSFRDIWITPHYEKNSDNLSHRDRVVSYTIYGSKEEVRKFLDIGHFSGNNKYGIKVLPHFGVELEQKGYKKAMHTGRLIENLGVTMSFVGDPFKNPQIEYIVVYYKKKKYEMQDFYRKREKDSHEKKDFDKDVHIVEVFLVVQEEPFFKEEFDEKVCFYKTYTIADRELIAIIFEKRVELYDLKSGDKITEIKTQENVCYCYISQQKRYLILSANNKVSIIDLWNNDQVKLTRTFIDQTVVSGVSMDQYAALASCAQKNEEKKLVRVFDLSKKNGFLNGFKLDKSEEYYYGFGKGWTEHDFCVMNHGANILAIFNLKPFQQLLFENFDPKGEGKIKIKDFQVEEEDGDLARKITIEFTGRPKAVRKALLKLQEPKKIKI